MQVKAVGHRLVIKPFSLEEADKVLASAKMALPGFTFLEQDERKLQISVDRGTVVEVGPSAFTALNPPGKDIPWCVVGDTIGYTRNAGKFISLDDGSHVLVINDEDVVNIFKED